MDDKSDGEGAVWFLVLAAGCMASLLATFALYGVDSRFWGLPLYGAGLCAGLMLLLVTRAPE